MVKVGDICSLFFNPMIDAYSVDSDYIQKFYVSDEIHLQVFATAGETVTAKLNDLSNDVTSTLSLSTYSQNEDVTMYYTVLTGMEDGVYRVEVNGEVSEPFAVCSDDDLLARTTLFRYSHKDNNSSFDNIFWIDATQQVFNFRIEGGFKPSGYSPKVANEQYRNQFQEITELYALPYDSYTLTLGDACGVPYWLIRHVNRLLCLSTVEVGGRLFVRSEGSVPELSPVMEEAQLFTATVMLESKENDVAGIGGRPEEASSSSVVGFVIDNPADGQMLQYSEVDSAFVNVTTVGV